jgi:DNA-binding NarL/FixJ family response regulator
MGGGQTAWATAMPEHVRDKSSRTALERNGRRVRVLTVDDQAVFRRVAKDVIVATLGFEAIGEAESGEDAVTAAERLRPDLVLLDVRMPGIGGIEAARRITTAHPDTVVVLISIEDPDEVSHTVRGSGAAALVRKQDFGPALLRRIWAEHLRTR